MLTYIERREKTDIALIETLVQSMAVLPDLRLFSVLETLLTDEVVVDYTSLVGGEPHEETPKGVIRRWKESLCGFDATQHKIENIVEINIDSGKAINGIKANKGMPRHLSLYRNREDINAVINCTSPSVLCLSKAGEVIYPLLDDMAQIVGTSLRTAPDSLNTAGLKKVVKAIKGRNSVLIYGQGALCSSGSMDDAHAICQVSEKACKSWIESAFLGGGHKINTVESALMRFVYLKKYSKQAVNNTLRS